MINNAIEYEFSKVDQRKHCNILLDKLKTKEDKFRSTKEKFNLKKEENDLFKDKETEEKSLKDLEELIKKQNDKDYVFLKSIKKTGYHKTGSKE